MIDVRDLAMPVGAVDWSVDPVLNRSVGQWAGLYAVRALEASHVRVVNPSRTIEICGDKALTSLTLSRVGLPVPRTVVAFSTKAALQAIEELGYPVVIKPITGSWGRLMAKINDRDAAEAVLEHKTHLASPQHRVCYIQEYVDKPGRDIRSIVIGGNVVAAYYRCSDHWVTNAARGVEGRRCEPSAEIADLSLRAAAAVGGDVVAVDLLETKDGRLLVNEVNHTPEFATATSTTGVDIAGRLVEHLVAGRA